MGTYAENHRQTLNIEKKSKLEVSIKSCFPELRISLKRRQKKCKPEGWKTIGGQDIPNQLNEDQRSSERVKQQALGLHWCKQNPLHKTSSFWLRTFLWILTVRTSASLTRGLALRTLLLQLGCPVQLRHGSFCFILLYFVLSCLLTIS